MGDQRYRGVEPQPDQSSEFGRALADVLAALHADTLQREAAMTDREVVHSRFVAKVYREAYLKACGYDD